MLRPVRLALLATAALAVAAPVAGASTSLQPGAHGTAVRALQERLTGLGYLPRGTADGVYGSTTGYGVMAFQKWAGLDRDGVAGPHTIAALRRAHRPHPISAGGG